MPLTWCKDIYIMFKDCVGNLGDLRSENIN